MTEVGLLDYLVLKSSPARVSDLPGRPELSLHAVLRTESGLFGTAEWNRAGAYLCPAYMPQADAKAAKSALVEALSERTGPRARQIENDRRKETT